MVARVSATQGIDMTENQERQTAPSSVSTRTNISTRTNGGDSEEYDSASSGLVRLLWVFLGPAGLIVYCFVLMQRDPQIHSLLSLGFWGLVAGVVFLRYLDLRVFGGTTAEGKPSTMADVQRYAVVVGGSAAAAWVVAHMV